MSNKRIHKALKQSKEKTTSQQLPQTRPFAPSVAPTHTASPVQAKLTIGQPNDKYEQEADQVAAQAVQQIHNPQAQREEDIQRTVAPEEEEEIKRMPAPEEEEEIKRTLLSPIRRMPIQRQGSIPTGPTSDEFEKNLSQSRSGGRSLDPQIQTKMESAIGANFSGIRIHTDTQADQLSRSIQAKAFTTGRDVFFKQGEYNPNSRSGQELLAHELTHTVQQGTATVSRKADSAHTKGCGCSNCTGQTIQRAIQREVDTQKTHQRKAVGVTEPSTIQRVVHENQATTGLRMQLPSDFVGGDDALLYLSGKVADVMDIPNTLNFTTDENKFALEFAKYLSIEKHGDESQAQALLQAAKKKIKTDKCRGFTNQKSETWYFGDQVETSDVIHEMVHILSAKGGQTQVMSEFGTPLNEGLTHLFTTKVCNLLGITVNPAYVEYTDFAERLESVYGSSQIYKTYFKGDIDGLVNAVTDRWETYIRNNKLGDGKTTPGWTEKRSSRDEKIDDVKKKLKEWTSNALWLNLRAGIPR